MQELAQTGFDFVKVEMVRGYLLQQSLVFLLLHLLQDYWKNKIHFALVFHCLTESSRKIPDQS